MTNVSTSTNSQSSIPDFSKLPQEKNLKLSRSHVSTTHTFIGGIAGTGKSEGKLQRGELSKIFGAWMLTLRCAFLLALLVSKALPLVGSAEVFAR
ncbi:MAG: hypothetical protein SGJ18_01175 [Pseudomonadota bacterium]|nr:hypothetical protein [Pseudomonadota bacterium]